MTDEALLLLTNMGAETSLRYAIHMINAAALVASKRKVCDVIFISIFSDFHYTLYIIHYTCPINSGLTRPVKNMSLQAPKVDVDDVQRVYELFVDVDRSREYLESSGEYISDVAMSEASNMEQ